MTRHLSIAEILSPTPPVFIRPLEIRLCWSRRILRDDGSPGDGGLWHPDTPENRETQRIAMEAGSHVFGLGTHWIEVREA